MVSTRQHPQEFPDPADALTTTTPSPTNKTSPRSSSMRSRPSTPSSPLASSSLTTLSGSSTTTTSYGYIHTPDRIAIIWLLISLPLVIWDTGYVLLRPHSMPGGWLHSPIWTPYALYGTVDYVYGWPAWERGDGFTAAQGSLNVIETAMYAFYLWVVWANGRVGGARRAGRVAKSSAGAGKKKSLWWFVLEENKRVENAALGVLMLWAAAVMTLSKTALYWLNEYFSSFANIGHNSTFDLIFLWIIPNGAWIVFSAYMIWSAGGEMWAALDAAGAKKSR